MKKIFVMPLAFVALASCATQTPDDFTSLYNANVKAEVAKMEDTFKTMYGPQKEITGQISGSAIVDQSVSSMTGTFSSNYTANVGGSPNSLMAFESPKLKIDSSDALEGDARLTSTTEASADKVELISGFSSLLKFDKITATTTASDVEFQQKSQKEIADMLANLEKFNGKWISLQEGVDAEMIKTLTRLSQLTEKDFEKYFTTHQVFTASGAAVVDGTKRTFNVELDKTQIINLIDAVVSDIGGKKMTEEEKNQALSAIKDITMIGTIAFDTKDPLYSDSHLVITSANQPQKIKVDATRNKEKLNMAIAVVSPAQNTEIEAFRLEVESISNGKNSDFTGKALVNLDGQTPTQIASFNGKVENLVLKNFNLDGTFQGLAGVNISYAHKNKLTAKITSFGQEFINVENTYTGEDFAGKIIFQGKEVANWNAVVKNETLKALTAWVADFVAIQTGEENPGKLLSIDLQEKEGSEMIHGKALITTTGQTTSADISLEATKKKFGLIVENILMNDEAGVFPLKKFDIFVTANERETSKKIELPTEIVPFEEFQKATGIASPSLDYNHDSSESMTEEEMNALLENASSIENLTEEEIKAAEEGLKNQEANTSAQ